MYRGFKSLRFQPLTEIKSKVNIPDTFPGLIVNALLFFPITTLTFGLLSSCYYLATFFLLSCYLLPSGFLEHTLNVASSYLGCTLDVPSPYLPRTFPVPSPYLGRTLPLFCIYQKNKSIINCSPVLPNL